MTSRGESIIALRHAKAVELSELWRDVEVNPHSEATFLKPAGQPSLLVEQLQPVGYRSGLKQGEVRLNDFAASALNQALGTLPEVVETIVVNVEMIRGHSSAGAGSHAPACLASSKTATDASQSSFMRTTT